MEVEVGLGMVSVQRDDYGVRGTYRATLVGYSPRKLLSLCDLRLREDETDKLYLRILRLRTGLVDRAVLVFGEELRIDLLHLVI